MLNFNKNLFYRYRAKDMSRETAGQQLIADSESRKLQSDCTQYIQSPIAWHGDTLERSNIIWTLNDAEKREIHDACCQFSDSGAGLGDSSLQAFSLPLSSDKLGHIRQNLTDGLGFSIIRGLNPDQYQMRENMVVLLGLSSYLGQQIGRQSGGKKIVHVIDLSGTTQKALHSPYRNGHLPFHTDPAADVVAMYVIEKSSQGGQGTFASASSIYNRLAATDSESLQQLIKPHFPFDKSLDGVSDFNLRPIIFLTTSSGKPEVFFSRGSIMRTQREDSLAPRLTHKQVAALDALNLAAEETAYCVEYCKGDIVFLNNRQILHGRHAFEDEGLDENNNGGYNGMGQAESRSPCRHILRLWLQDTEAYGPPPEEVVGYWRKAFGERIRRSETEEWPLIPDTT